MRFEVEDTAIRKRFKSEPMSIIVSGISYAPLCALLASCVKARLHPAFIRSFLGKPARRLLLPVSTV